MLAERWFGRRHAINCCVLPMQFYVWLRNNLYQTSHTFFEKHRNFILTILHTQTETQYYTSHYYTTSIEEHPTKLHTQTDSWRNTVWLFTLLYNFNWGTSYLTSHSGRFSNKHSKFKLSILITTIYNFN